MRARTTGHKPDVFLLALVTILAVAGLIILASASSDLGRAKFNNSYYYLLHQIMFGLSLGLAGFITACVTPYRHYRKIALPLLLASIVLLFLVFTPLGPEIRQTHRWVVIGPVSFQPAELLKLSFILYLAAWLSNMRISREKNMIEGYIPFLIVTGVVTILLILQPATSTVVILITAGLIVYFTSGAKLKYIAVTVLIGIVALTGIILVTPYRLQRIKGYLGGGKDIRGSSYHLNQALIAIESGGVTGVGYGQSIAKLRNLPEPVDDSIFAILAEEFGFIGSSTVISLFAMLTFRLFWLGKRVGDKFGRLILIGFASVIALQTIVHIASISGILPLTGVPLPFVSYGGTALAVFLTMMGIAVNVSKYT